MTQFERLEARGWKEICQALGVRTKDTARKILRSAGLLCYEGRTPVLNLEVYKMASINRHSVQKTISKNHTKIAKKLLNVVKK
ncbi:MAG: hypothetical protein HQL06_00945 [Nitrospirae bacterium]|nr:hypothetical protein [Nitrospirota bacterium]